MKSDEKIAPKAGVLLRLVLGLMGGGILAAPKGFAEGLVRPATPAEAMLSLATELSLPADSSLRLGTTARLARLPILSDGQPQLRMDADLESPRKAAANMPPLPEDSLPLRSAARLRIAADARRTADTDKNSSLTLTQSFALAAAATTTGPRESLRRSEEASIPAPTKTPTPAREALSPGTGPAPLQNAPLQTAQGTSSAKRSEDRSEESSAPETPVPFEAVRPGPPSSPSDATPRAAMDLPDLGDPGYRLAPIRWGGTTGSSMGWNQDASGGRSLSSMQNLETRAASYIYQPWFARLSGNLGVTSAGSKTTPAASSDSSGGGATSNSSTAFNYGGVLNLFPDSRFPFAANFNQENNSASAQDQSIKSSSTRFGARQNYRPEGGKDNYAANFDRSVVNTVNGKSNVNSAGATYNDSFGDHSLGSSLRYSANGGDVGGQSSQLFGANATHTWRMDEDFNISTSANFSNSQVKILSGNTIALNNSQLWQANSSFMWVPDPDLPLTINGGGGLLTVQTDTGLDKNQQLSMNSYVNGTYRFSPNLSLNGSGTLGRSQSKTGTGASTSLLNSSQTASASYAGDPIKLFDFSYGWNTGGSFSNQLSSGGTENQSSQSIGANAGHFLSRAFSFNPANVLNMNLSQSYGLSKSSSAAIMSSTLNHSAGASLRSAFSETLVGSFSATGSDSISAGQSDSHFRTFSVSGNGQWQVNRRAGFNTSVNAVWTQQITSATNTGDASPAPSVGNSPATWSGSGSIGYSHRNPFDITNLLYGATYSVTTSQTNLRVAAGDPDALSWVVSSALMQRLDYLLGRVKFQATGALATVDGKKNASVYFSMQRAFGDF